MDIREYGVRERRAMLSALPLDYPGRSPCCRQRVALMQVPAHPPEARNQHEYNPVMADVEMIEALRRNFSVSVVFFPELSHCNCPAEDITAFQWLANDLNLVIGFGAPDMPTAYQIVAPDSASFFVSKKEEVVGLPSSALEKPGLSVSICAALIRHFDAPRVTGSPQKEGRTLLHPCVTAGFSFPSLGHLLGFRYFVFVNDPVGWKNAPSEFRHCGSFVADYAVPENPRVARLGLAPGILIADLPPDYN